MFPSKSNWVSS